MEKEQLQQKYRESSKKLSKIGYICKGSVMSVYIKCGKPYCRCKTDKNTKHGPYTVWTRKVKGKTVAFVRHPAALAEECERADIVVAQIPINRPCPNARVTVDRIDLWADGAHALYLDGQSIRVETVAQSRGARPWSRTVSRRRKPAPDGNAYAGETDAPE